MLGRGLVLTVAFGAALVTGCGDDGGAPTDAGADAATIPRTDAGATCTADADCTAFERCDPCASSSCPMCDDCIGGCVPHTCPTADVVGLTCSCERPTTCGPDGVGVIQDGCWTCVAHRTCDPLPVTVCDATAGVMTTVLDALYGVGCMAGGDEIGFEIEVVNATDTPLPFTFDTTRALPPGGGAPIVETPAITVVSTTGDIDDFTGTVPAVGTTQIRIVAPVPSSGPTLGGEVGLELDVTVDGEGRTLVRDPVVASACGRL